MAFPAEEGEATQARAQGFGLGQADGGAERRRREGPCHHQQLSLHGKQITVLLGFTPIRILEHLAERVDELVVKFQDQFNPQPRPKVLSRIAVTKWTQRVFHLFRAVSCLKDLA